MGVPPPPPPPGPPPPPMGGLKLNSGSSGGGDTRAALLQSIQKGAKLKKTVTVDKSAPIISGKATSNVSQASTVKAPSNNGSMTNGGNAKLGGIFEGMSKMPTLKPVGGRGASTTPTSRSPPSEREPYDSTPSNYNSNGPALDFNAELTKHLTLKKQKKQQQDQSANATEANLRTNRGPPPQPPAQKQYTVDPTSKGKSSPPAIPPPPIIQQQHSNESNTSGLFKKQTNSHSTSQSPTTNGISISSNAIITPNKSSLFNNMSQATNVSSSSPSSSSSVDRESNSSISSLNNTSNSTQLKPVPNHGKPNCAPKPPGIQQIIAAKNGNSGTTNGSNGTGRPTVARHHSMKTPRSPPVATGGPVFPSTQHFGTMRGAPQQFQSQDAINRPAPTAPIGRPTVAPPRPPNIKPPPPPTPIRSISNQNLTNLPLSLPPNAVNSNSNFGSASNVSTVSNVSTLKKQMIHQIGSGSVNDVSMHNTTNSNSISNNVPSNNNLGMQTEKSAPPLPPHRTCPAPPPPMRQNSNSLSATTPAPVPPQRHSSIRNSSVSQTTVTMQSATVTTTTKQVNRLIIDLEKKFSQNFHNVTEFRPPGPFTDLPKSYPSRNVKSVNAEIRKPQAPSPPVKQQKYYMELGDDGANTNNNTTTYC